MTRFLHVCNWLPCTNLATHGTTWLELVLAYLWLGGSLEARTNSEFRTINMREAIREFKAIWTRTIQARVNPDDAWMLTPACGA